MSRKKILVTGSNGQLGKELQVLAIFHEEFDFIFLSKEDLPVHDKERVYHRFDTIRPQYCINCAAYTAVDRAETEKERAFLINGTSTGILAEACKTFGTKFIHISTDYVFNGRGMDPYKEDDTVDPVNTYGASKLVGEDLAVSENDQSVIIRTSWVYSEFGNNFVKTMIRLMQEKESLGVVNDQKGSPTYGADLAKVIMEIIKSKQWISGIFHYSNEGIITWYEFALAIKTLIDSPCVIKPITTEDFPTPAKRPAYSAFDKRKIVTDYNTILLDWKDSLKICIQHISNLA